MRTGLAAFVLMVTSLSVLGQKENYFLLEGKVHYGFVMPHSHRVNHLVTGHTRGFQLNIGVQGVGNKKLDKIYNYPQTGIALAYLDFANPGILGSGICVLGYADLPVVRKNNFLFSIQLADGLGFATKRFDAAENRKNTLMGSKLNAAIQILFQTKYVLSRHTDFRLSLGLTHFSNGSFETPNLGINNVSLSSGIVYYFDSIRPMPAREILPPPDKRIRLELVAAGGPKEIYPAGGKKYFAWTFSATAFKMFSHKYRLGIGADYIYDLSLTERFARDSIFSSAVSDRMRVGIYIANELMLSRIYAILGMGYYVYSPFKRDGNMYHRIGWKFICNDHWFINNTLRAHYGKADNIEIGLGYRF